MNDKGETGKVLCERAARYAWPDATPEQIAARARRYWDASPTGELWHVYNLIGATAEQQATMMHAVVTETP